MLVSAIISEGRPSELLMMAAKKRFLLVTSEELMQEFTQVLQKPRFRLTKWQINDAVRTVNRIVRIVKTASTRKVIVEDPDDDIIVNTALDGNADYIVSGDGHLLKLAEFKGIKIVSVADMLKILE